jgi:putative SOS response-associated peptidase YedK
MTELMQANRQWSTRAPDERFTSLLEMQAFKRSIRDRSQSHVISSRNLEVLPMENDPRGLQVAIGATGAAASHWSFGQLCSLASPGNSPASYFRETNMPSPMIADCLNYNLKFTRGVEDVGLLFWAKDIKVGFSNINAKAEGIEVKPAFREAFQRRRCLVPVENFYEWKKVAAGKQPYAIALADRGLMALAGLWENWRSPAGEWVRSFAIITTTPNDLCTELHNRMPVVLGHQAWPEWLGDEFADLPRLKPLLAPYLAEEIQCWPVSTRVGNVKNNDPSLIEPGALAGESQ